MTRIPRPTNGQATPSRGQSLTPFSYDWESVFPGYNPDDLNWEDPQPLDDSPPNLQWPGYYTGPMTSRLIAGAGAGEADMGEVADPWGNAVLAQPPVPPPEPLADRMDQLIQQVALLRDENLCLNNDIADLHQRANQRGLTRSASLPPRSRSLLDPCLPGWAPPGNGPVRDWDADKPPAFLSARPIMMKLPEPFEGEHNDMDRFIGDCNAYFETFRHQFRGVSSLIVVCATSLFTKHAKSWWTHQCKDFWVNDYRDPTGPQF